MIKYFGQGSWIENGVAVTTVDDADLVIIPGGADVCPSLYRHKAIRETKYYLHNDIRDLKHIDRAIKLGKRLFGICRGLQLLTVRSGGWLIQDIYHPYRHDIVTYDNKILKVNSAHHQMCYPYDLPTDLYEVLAWGKGISNRYVTEHNGTISYTDISYDEDGNFMEPEIIYYPKIKALGVQNHPEWTGGNCPEYYKFVNNLINSKLF